MGIFQSSPAANSAHSTRLGPHGPALEPRRGRRLNWWEVVKLGAVTVSVGALQWLKVYFLMLEDRATQQRINQRRQGRHERERQESEQKNFATGLPPEARQAVITMIDHIVTPMLVDQWRLGLVKVLLDPEEGPVLPDRDPDMRKALLASLQTYQAERDARPAFRAGEAPARYSRSEQHQGPSSVHARPEQPGNIRPAAHARPGEVLAEHQPSSSAATPSAPPLCAETQDPSAPPLSDWELVEPEIEELQKAPEECGVCLDAKVEVEIDNCHHHLCVECAKAICCLEGRAPQCPFCRGAMTGVSALSP